MLDVSRMVYWESMDRSHWLRFRIANLGRLYLARLELAAVSRSIPCTSGQRRYHQASHTPVCGVSDMPRRLLLVTLVVSFLVLPLRAADPSADTMRDNRLRDGYFRQQVKQI